MMNYIKNVTGNRSFLGSMSTLNIFQSKTKTSFQATNQRSVVPNQPIVTRPYSKLQPKSLDSFRWDGHIYQMNRTIKNKQNNSLLSLTSILCLTLYMENTPLDNMTVLFQSNQHSTYNTQPDEDNTLLGIFNEDVLKATQSEKKERKTLKYSSAIACERPPDNLMYLLLQMVPTLEIYCWPFQNEEHRKLLSEKSSLARLVKCSQNEHVGRIVMFSLSIKNQNSFLDKSNNCRDLAGEKQHKRNNSPSAKAKLKDTGDDIQPSNMFTKEQRSMVIYYVFFQCLTFSLYYVRQVLDQLDTDTVAMMKPFSLYIVQFGLLLLFIYIKWLLRSPSSLKDN